MTYRPCSFPTCKCSPETCNPGEGYCCFDCREKPENSQSKADEDAYNASNAAAIQEQPSDDSSPSQEPQYGPHFF